MRAERAHSGWIIDALIRGLAIDKGSKVSPQILQKLRGSTLPSHYRRVRDYRTRTARSYMSTWELKQSAQEVVAHLAHAFEREGLVDPEVLPVKELNEALVRAFETWDIQVSQKLSLRTSARWFALQYGLRIGGYWKLAGGASPLIEQLREPSTVDPISKLLMDSGNGSLRQLAARVDGHEGVDRYRTQLRRTLAPREANAPRTRAALEMIARAFSRDYESGKQFARELQWRQAIRMIRATLESVWSVSEVDELAEALVRFARMTAFSDVSAMEAQELLCNGIFAPRDVLNGVLAPQADWAPDREWKFMLAYCRAGQNWPRTEKIMTSVWGLSLSSREG